MKGHRCLTLDVMLLANYSTAFLLDVTCKSLYKYFLAVVDDDALVVSVNFDAHKVVGV